MGAGTKALLMVSTSALPARRTAAVSTKERAMTAATLQVQLCEYRQFRHARARDAYGLPDDDSMRCEVQTKSLGPEHFIALDKENKCYSFEYPMEGKKIKFQVALKALGNNSMVAKRVATMCFSKFSHGSSNADVCKFREELLQSYRGDVQDVSPDSEAWQFCRTQLTHENPVVPFQFEDKTGKKLPFQTTVRAAGGSILHAERIARLCWEKLKSGVKKDEVIEYRKRLYEKVDSGSSKQKQEQSGCGKRALSASAVATPQKRCRLSA